MSLATLIRRDATFRSLGTWLPLSIISTLVLFGVLAALVETKGEFDSIRTATIAVALILWTGTVFYFFLGNLERRCHDMDLALPLSARRLWLAHNLTVILGGLIALGLSAAAGFSVLALLTQAGEIQGIAVDRLSLLLYLPGAFVLMVAIVQGQRPAQRDAPAGRRGILTTLLAIVGMGAFMALLMSLPPIFAVIPFMMAAIVMRRTWSLLPSTFMLVGHELSPGPGNSTSAIHTWDASRLTSATRGIHWMLLRSYALIPKIWFLLAITMIYAVALADGGQLIFDNEVRFLFLPLTVYMLLAVTPVVLNQLFFVDNLPVGRKVLFRYLVGPPLTVLLLALLFVEVAHQGEVQGRVVYEYSKRGEFYMTTVPDRFWKATDQSTTTIVAPWGESHEAFDDKILKGMTTHLYSPFSTPRESSPRFVAWQLSRAVEEVYGRTISVAEIEAQLTVDQAGRVVPREEGLAFLADSSLRARSKGPVGPLLYGVTLTMWFLLLAYFLGTYRIGIPEAQRKRAMMLIFGSLLGFLVLQVGLAILDYFEPDMVVRYLEIRMMELAQNPAAVGLLWLACLSAVGGSWFVARRVFERVEAIPTRGCATLI